MRKKWIVFCLLTLFLLGCGSGAAEEALLLPEAGETDETAALNQNSMEPRNSNNNNMMSGGGMMSNQGETVERTEKRPSLATQAGNTENLAIQIAANHPPIADYLAGFDWVGSAYPHDESEQTWGVDFSTSNDEEWLGWADVDVVTSAVNDFFVPRDLPPDELQAGQALIKTFLEADAEMNALLVDQSLWEREIWYNRWDANWEAWFGRGLDEWIVVLYLDPETDEIWVESISDPSILEEEEQRQWDRNQAVELAFEAEGLWETLDGVEGWRTLASDHGNGVWTVDFVAPGQLYFSAVVDIVNWQIVEAGES